MIVRLTQRQFATLIDIAVEDRRFTPWFDRNERPKSRPGMVDVPMPAIGWRVLLAKLEEFLVGPRGGLRADAKRNALNARMRIAQQLNIMGSHPALSDIGILIKSTLVIPAWQLKPYSTVSGPDRVWKIYPTGGQFWILVPRQVEWGNKLITKWAPEQPVKPVGLLDEREHLVFLDGFVLPAEDDGKVMRKA